MKNNIFITSGGSESHECLITNKERHPPGNTENKIFGHRLFLSWFAIYGYNFFKYNRFILRGQFLNTFLYQIFST